MPKPISSKPNARSEQEREARLSVSSPRAVYCASRSERVQFIRAGVPAAFLDQIAGQMAIPKELLYKSLRLPRSTVDRKLRANDRLSPEHSERVIGLERLIGQADAMVAESGDGAPFNAHAWVGAWLESPLPALGGAKPADYMDTMEGQEMVSTLLAQMQSGAYA